MRYFGTTFSITLAGCRLRIRIDLDDVPDEEPQLAQVRALPATRRAGPFTSR
ncbi:MAG TPA: hypothetical protein VKG44_02995 [Candidatus Baltobacteraceae bacterium]|nr:hypothetical protein [Candidatus Baltobacteraceae bacterium]